MIRMEPGVQTPGRDARTGERLVPGHRVGFWFRFCAAWVSRRVSFPVI